IACAKSFIGNEPFAVLLGDDIVHNDDKPCLQQLIDVYEYYNSSVLGVQQVDTKDVHKYGIVDGQRLEQNVSRVNRLVEKPKTEDAPSNIAILGRYIIMPSIFEILENTAPGANGEIQLTDALNQLSRTEAVYAYEFEGRRYDVGDKQGFLEATVEYALRKEELREPFLAYLRDITKQEG